MISVAKCALTILRSSGLLVAACVNRAPEGTFGCAVADVGVLDMLKVGSFVRCFIHLLNDKSIELVAVPQIYSWYVPLSLYF